MADGRVVEELISRLLVCIGEDVTRKGLQDTPKRVAKMYEEVFRGYDSSTCPTLTHFPNGEDGILYDEMIIDHGYFFSYCEHHIVPFFGTFYFGYIPNELVIGASKIARLVDWYSARLQTQERLVSQVVSHFCGIIQPKGCGLVIRGRHLCKEMRGVKKVNSPFETIALTGCFKESATTRSEFMMRIGDMK